MQHLTIQGPSMWPELLELKSTKVSKKSHFCMMLLSKNGRSLSCQSRSMPRIGTVSAGKHTPALGGRAMVVTGYIAEQQRGQEIFLQLSLESTICYTQVLIVEEQPSTFHNGPKSLLLPAGGLSLEKHRHWTRALLRILQLQGTETCSTCLRKNRILIGKHSRLPLK